MPVASQAEGREVDDPHSALAADKPDRQATLRGDPTVDVAKDLLSLLLRE